MINRAFEIWKPRVTSNFEKKLRKLEQDEGYFKKDLGADQGCELFHTICRNFGVCTLFGVNISVEQAKIALTWFALEMHCSQSPVAVSPHVLLHGISGGGKTVLMQLLTSLSNASSIPPDASGVGKCILVGRQKCFTVEDAGRPFFRNEGYADLMKTCYHRDFSTSTYGSKTDFRSAAFFIATNVPFPFEEGNLDLREENRIAMPRRFLQIEFVSKLHTPADTFGFKNQMEICEAIANSIAAEFPSGKVTVEGDREVVEPAEQALNNMLRLIRSVSNYSPPAETVSQPTQNLDSHFDDVDPALLASVAQHHDDTSFTETTYGKRQRRS